MSTIPANASITECKQLDFESKCLGAFAIGVFSALIITKLATHHISMGALIYGGIYAAGSTILSMRKLNEKNNLASKANLEKMPVFEIKEIPTYLKRIVSDLERTSKEVMNNALSALNLNEYRFKN